jgi:hypothetical protein
MYSANANVTCRKDKSIPYSNPPFEKPMFLGRNLLVRIEKNKASYIKMPTSLSHDTHRYH